MEPQKPLPFPASKLAELLLRARRDGIVLTPIPRSRRIMRASSSTGSTVYYVDADTCTCKAGQCGVPCKHRALWIQEHANEYADALLTEITVLAAAKTRVAS